VRTDEQRDDDSDPNRQKNGKNTTATHLAPFFSPRSGHW